MIELKEKKDEELQEYILALESPEKKRIIDIGNAIFPNSEKRELETKLGEKIQKEKIILTLTKLKEKYKHVFTLEEIKQEVIKFGLNFTSTRNYKGNYDYEYITKIKDFLDANNTTILDNDLQYHFFILDSATTKKNPLIFYKHRETKQDVYFVMIDGDKNYVNPINWLKGWAEETAWTKRFSTLLFIVALSSLFTFLLSYFVPSEFVLFIPLTVFAIGLIGITINYQDLKEYELRDESADFKFIQNTQNI